MKLKGLVAVGVCRHTWAKGTILTTQRENNRCTETHHAQSNPRTRPMRTQLPRTVHLGSFHRLDIIVRRRLGRSWIRQWRPGGQITLGGGGITTARAQGNVSHAWAAGRSTDTGSASMLQEIRRPYPPDVAVHCHAVRRQCTRVISHSGWHD